MTIQELKSSIARRLLMSHQEAAKANIRVIHEEAVKFNVPSVIIEFGLQFDLKSGTRDLCQFKVGPEMIEKDGPTGFTSLAISTDMLGDIVKGIDSEPDELKYISISYHDSDEEEGELIAPLLSISTIYLMSDDDHHVRLPLFSPILLAGDEKGNYLNLNQQVGSLLPTDCNGDITDATTCLAVDDSVDFDEELSSRITTTTANRLN